MDTTLINDNNRFVGKLDSIQLLRAITALLIFFYHIDYICNFKLFDFGRGVHLFFVISGFVIMYSTQKETNKHFIEKRMLRLLPLYWLLTVASFAALKILPGIIRG
ncbi:MAG: acyltransferase family protein, partial [Oscillospiraceae bacterium]